MGPILDMKNMKKIKSLRRSRVEFGRMGIQQNPGVTLSRFICEQKWPRVERLIESLRKSNSIGAIRIDERCIISPENILHFACRFSAPLATMQLLAAVFPRSASHVDESGRVALHIAAKHGAMPEVVEFLIIENPKSACIQDYYGKTPMHYVGEFYGRHYDPNAEIPLNKSMLRVVKGLKIAAPKSVILEDCDGFNAIELALESDADIRVINSMQRASRDDWREMNAREMDAANGKKHEELLNDIERNAEEERVNMKRTIILSDVDTVRDKALYKKRRFFSTQSKRVFVQGQHRAQA